MAAKKESRDIRKKIALLAAAVGVILCILTLLFVQGVKTELWEQSVNTIMESTGQGCGALRIQLQDEYEFMESLAPYVKKYTPKDEGLEQLLSFYARAGGISLYLPEGTSLPSDIEIDEKAAEALSEEETENGIIDPHISSVTGVNVFDLFSKITLRDGTEAWLLKEFEVGSIVDTFSLSFYNNAGFSYVVNTKGDILIRATHPKSNKTVQNLFDMLPVSENDGESLKEFAQSLEQFRTGWAVFTYQGEENVFCYTPLVLQSDWYLVSIIPKDVVEAQTNSILLRSLALVGSVLFSILLLAAFYIRYVNRTNRKLTNQANYIGHLYNALPEGIAVLNVEPPYRILQLNDEGLRLLDYPADSPNDALSGRSLRDVVYPEDYDRIEQLFRDAAAGRRKGIFENRLSKGNGDYFWASGIIEMTPDENGIDVFIAAFHDITREKLAEEDAEREKLQERLTLVGALSNAYPVIISMNLTQDTLNFIYIKSGLMLGLGDQKTYSKLFEDMTKTVHPENLEKFKEFFTPENLRGTLGREKNEVFLEARQRLTDGSYHWTSTQIIYVDNPYSDDRLAVLISRRVDEQRYEEEQRRQVLQSALDNAREANDAKSRFLSNMSHDIRTPMNAVIGMTAIAEAHLEDRQRVLECLRKIRLSGNHLLSLINDVLDMSKIESGKLSLRDEAFNFAELTVETVELVRSQAEARKQRLDLRLAMLKNESVLGDPLRIRQIYINILSNAVKYTPEGGSIRIDIDQEESSRREYAVYLFRCSDTGVGMSAEFLEKLFQPFERAHDSTGSRITGTGLGMAITKNIVDLLNGEIQVESSPNEGSVFTVRLPLRLQDAPREEAPQEWIDARCLIAYSEEKTCEEAAELFRDLGLRTQYAAGSGAVAAAGENAGTDPFRIVLVDWKICVEGMEMLQCIRKEIGPECPIVLLTDSDWAESEGEAREAGVTAFLSKPFYRSKICSLLRGLGGEQNWNSCDGPISPVSFAGCRVLLAEDNELNREIAGMMLEAMGILADEACDGAEAVEKVKSGGGIYDLILMDVRMPNMDGYEATRAIRKLEDSGAVRAVPIVAMTANAFDEDVQDALRAGMDAHIAKPVDPEILRSTLCRLLNPQNET